MHGDGALRAIQRRNRSRNISEAARDNLLSCQFAAIRAFLAARSQLIAGPDFPQRRGLSIVKLYRARCVAPQDGIFCYVHGNSFLFPQGRRGNA